ncbi:hypothetical protein SDC9_181860 [bioreactor metagenome]|uniref:Uncharacterized protein n=1 Tax=bioreactor metagenome TaxID=1076179 RepID=A0A645H5T2_9ZZZZ
MYDRKIKQRKRMRTTPPAGGVCGVTAMGRPGVTFIFLKAIEIADILGVTYCFKNAHVLAA